MAEKGKRIYPPCGRSVGEVCVEKVFYLHSTKFGCVPPHLVHDLSRIVEKNFVNNFLLDFDARTYIIF